MNSCRKGSSYHLYYYILRDYTLTDRIEKRFFFLLSAKTKAGIDSMGDDNNNIGIWTLDTMIY